MTRRWRWTELDVVRARIAATALPDRLTDARLGEIVLREHQRDAAARLRQAIDRFGGALLADEVGLGKTFTALATARDAGAILIVAPAALTGMWRAALERAELRADVVSFETLSRRDAASDSYDFVIIDEAHHARNPLTRRYERLASVTRAARVLLLTATPVHNAAADLHAMLSLFLGSRAERLDSGQLSACVIRRTRDDVRDVPMPRRSDPTWCDVDAPPDALEAVLAVPPPCPPRDGGAAGALVILSLVRSWSSTEAALRSALRRRVARADSFADALTTGRYPTRAELRAWVVGDDATQLAFPELMTDAIAGDARALLESVRRHAAGARQALAIVARHDGVVDDQRAAIIRDIRDRHRGERIVVFSSFAESVRAMFARLRTDGGVAAVTAGGAMVAGGPLTRTQVLSRFAPVASRSHSPSRAEAVELLIATDLLSEGLNLQDASVVVHLDLPWTAARLTQRLGRVWRLGSPHERVYEYALTPPAPAERVLRVTELLARKAGAAWSAVGEAFAPLLARRHAAAAPTTLDRGRAVEELRRTLRRWANVVPERSASSASVRESDGAPAVVVAGVRAATDGWIAVVEHGGREQLIAAKTGEVPDSDPHALLALACAADGEACVASPSRVMRVLHEIESYLEAARAAADAGVAAVGSRARAVAASRIAALAAAAPPHRRVAVSRLAAHARGAVAGSRSAGAERLLAALIARPLAGADADGAAEVWLDRVIEAGERGAPNVQLEPDDARPPRVCALVVLVGVALRSSSESPEVAGGG
jgi:superfamily II DNA or RNA helicase